ncbi:MAG: hypothetical protein ACR2OD_01540, partial [Gaiellaceae bacterium]
MHDRSGLRELSQTFTFPNATSAELADVLARAPLVGRGSIFGKKVTSSTRSEGNVRYAYGFQPAPGPLLRFDVVLTQAPSNRGLMVRLELLQPSRRRAYLEGQFVWLLTDAPDSSGAVLQEEINTPTALELVDRPLHGSPFSLRRFLFFAGGHERLMKDAAANIRQLLASGP